MNSGFWRRKISYILKEKCGEVGAHQGECSDKLFYMIGLGKSRGMSGVPLFSYFPLFSLHQRFAVLSRLGFGNDLSGNVNS